MGKNDLITVIITVFVAVVIVDTLSKEFPKFTIYGWGIVGAFVSGVVWHYKNKYFK